MSSNIKAFYTIALIVFCMTALATPKTVNANQTEQERAEMIQLLEELMARKAAAEGKTQGTKKSKSLKGASWTKAKNSNDTPSKDSAEIETEDGATADESSLTPEEKLWKKYKALSEKNKKKTKTLEKEKEAEKNQQAQKISQTNDTDEEQENDAEQEEAEPTESFGIMSILKKYKEANKDKGGLNSKSFGQRDRDEEPEPETVEEKEEEQE